MAQRNQNNTKGGGGGGGGEKKNKLRTSEDVYDRIKWDQSFAQDDFIIGYTDRFRGMMEIPFLEFTPGGDIPYHRIYYFRNSEGFVWDRETRFDLIFHSGEHDGQYSEEAIAFRNEEMQHALKANAEAEEEKRQLADQMAKKKLARIRQAARRSQNNGKLSWYLPSYLNNNDDLLLSSSFFFLLSSF
jgi:uncharacterized protein (UPF0248 family)